MKKTTCKLHQPFTKTHQNYITIPHAQPHYTITHVTDAKK